MTVSEREHLHPPQEPDALSWKWITAVAVGVIVLTVALSIIAAWAVGHYRDELGGRAAQQPLLIRPPDNQLEFHLFEDQGIGEGQRAQQTDREWLESWGWVDRQSGLVRVPIDVAMDLVAPGQEQP